MYLDKKLVFLAGSTGIAGSSIMRHILDNYPKTKIRAAYYKHTKPFIKDKKVNYVYGDLKSEPTCRRMVKGCDCVILAAANTVGSNIVSPSDYGFINDNTIMNIQILNACRLEKIRRLIYIGSATLYQEFEGYIKEGGLDFNKDPHPAYMGIGWIGRYIEKLCKYWHERIGIEIVIARSANIFGPYAKFNFKTSNFIPAIIRKAVDRNDPFEVLGSPDVARDVVYSEDFGRAVVMMLDNARIKFDTFNIGSGVKTTVGQVVHWALKYAGHSPAEIRYIPGKATAKSRLLDCSKIKEAFGWQPTFTIEEGIRKTTEWWFENRKCWTK